MMHLSSPSKTMILSPWITMILVIYPSFIILVHSSSCICARTLMSIHHPTTSTRSTSSISVNCQEFEKFKNVKIRGSNYMIKGLTELKKYFHRFGYDLKGGMDSHMLHATRDYAFFTGQPRWSRSSPMSLTYGFSPENSFIPSLSKKEISDAFRLAFDHWSSVIPVSFLETDDYGVADIKIGFYFGDHGDSEPFDGALGFLAHAFAPESGRFHLDAAETWAVDFNIEKSDVAVDLESVATHEIGHLLGLGHSSFKEAVMYPSLKPREKKVDLKLDDIKGIQALYGINPNFTIEALSEPYISSNNVVSVRVYCSFLSRCFLLLGFIQLLLFF